LTGVTHPAAKTEAAMPHNGKAKNRRPADGWPGMTTLRPTNGGFEKSMPLFSL
jgi:hypothetical protein